MYDVLCFERKKSRFIRTFARIANQGVQAGFSYVGGRLSMVQDDWAESANQRKGRSAFLQVACLALLFWIACVLGLFLPYSAIAQTSSATDGWSIQSSSGEGAVSTEHQVQWQEGKAYVFLPASADLSQTQLTNNSQNVFLINGRKLAPGKTLAFSHFVLGSGATAWTVPVRMLRDRACSTFRFVVLRTFPACS